MLEMHGYINRPKPTQFKLSLMRYPTGRWGFVGSIPISLTVEKTNSIGQDFRDSKIYETEERAINDAKLNGYKMNTYYPIRA